MRGKVEVKLLGLCLDEGNLDGALRITKWSHATPDLERATP